MEGAVGADGHAGGDGGADDVVCGAGVEFLCRRLDGAMYVYYELLSNLAEVHGLHTFTSQCWTYRRRWRGLPGADDKLDDLIALHYALGHGGG